MQFFRVVVVTGLVIWAAVLATPKGRPPIALRAIRKMLGKSAPPGEETEVGVRRRIIAFFLVLAALAIALVR